MTTEDRTNEDGTSSRIYYTDDVGRPVDKSVATKAEIIEYDANNNEVKRTYGTINRE